ncbi:MAG: hypothetical protein OEX02_02105 [Cyclobacteriaceae bacterium]|nr:hypothetical protein [Cyclobacteriaceae bacterium]
MPYIKTEINIIDFLMDRVSSDVHILITSQRTGDQGRQYQMIFYGQNDFTGTTDTLHFNTGPNATDFERRDEMLKYLKLGLGPWIAKTNKVSAINISMKSNGENTEEEEPTDDKWNFWVFRIGGNGSVNADKVYKSYRLNGNFSINRITDESKLRFYYYGGQNSSRYDYEDDNGAIVHDIVTNDRHNVFHQYVKSLNDHWSAGYTAHFRNDTFSNYKSRISLFPGIEYSIFPYQEVNNRFFTLNYSVGAESFAYIDSTIYEKKDEILARHNVAINLRFIQKWGNIRTGIEYHNYFHDWKYYRLSAYSDIEVRITGGLSFNTYFYGGLIHDQFNLRKGGATEAEVLTRRKQLESGYDINAHFGLSYRFGSKLSNFVNPRFDD